MKNRFYSGIMLSLVLAVGLSLTGCPDLNQPEIDVWTKIASASEIIGTWEGSITIPIPAIEETEPPLPASSIPTKLNMTVTEITFSERLTMDMNKYLTDMVGAAEKATMWESITDYLPSEVEEDGTSMIMEADDGYKLVITINAPISLMVFTGENAEYAPFINQNKTKLKMLLPADLNPYGEGDMEFILDKKE